MKEEKIHRELFHLDDFKELDVDQEWSLFLEKTELKQLIIAERNEVSNEGSSPIRRLPRFALASAASLILLIGCMYFFNLKPATDIDPILAEETVPIEEAVEVQVPDPEPIVSEPELVEAVVLKEQVNPVDPIVVDKKPLVIANSPKLKAPQPEFKLYQAGELIDLSDGSSVEVTSLAMMSIPQSFQGHSARNVKIRSGQAEFAVVKDESRPFTVTTTNSEVSVLGTTFSLLSEGIETTVKTIKGLVEFYSLADPETKIAINAGEEYKFDGSTIEKISEPIEEPIVEKEEETSEYPLHGIESLLKTSYQDKVKITSSSFKKSERDTRFSLPAAILTTPNQENLNRIIEILKSNFDSKIVDGDCEGCYIIQSIRIKEE